MSDYGMGLHLHIVSRKQAKALGMTHFFTGKPCKRGGVFMRRVSNHDCLCEACIEGERARCRRYGEAHRDSCARRVREWSKRNPSAKSGFISRRRSAKRARVLIADCELTSLIEREARSLAAERSAQTGIDWHIDHLMPMQGDVVSGLHHWSNLQVIPAALNLSKGNRMIYTEPFEWLKDA